MTPPPLFPDARAAKARLRAEALARRRAVGETAQAALAARLARVGLELATTRRAGCVAAFLPIRSEPDPGPLLAALAERGFACALPVAASREAEPLFRAWAPGELLRLGALNIREPASEAPRVEPDLVFVPLAAFDRRGHRIGFGAGFYDRALANLRARGPLLAVGVAFSVAEISEAPAEPHDQALDAVITETETIWINP